MLTVFIFLVAFFNYLACDVNNTYFGVKLKKYQFSDSYLVFAKGVNGVLVSRSQFQKFSSIFNESNGLYVEFDPDSDSLQALNLTEIQTQLFPNIFELSLNMKIMVDFDTKLVNNFPKLRVLHLNYDYIKRNFQQINLDPKVRIIWGYRNLNEKESACFQSDRYESMFIKSCEHGSNFIEVPLKPQDVQNVNYRTFTDVEVGMLESELRIQISENFKRNPKLTYINISLSDTSETLSIPPLSLEQLEQITGIIFTTSGPLSKIFPPYKGLKHLPNLKYVQVISDGIEPRVSIDIPIMDTLKHLKVIRFTTGGCPSTKTNLNPFLNIMKRNRQIQFMEVGDIHILNTCNEITVFSRYEQITTELNFAAINTLYNDQKEFCSRNDYSNTTLVIKAKSLEFLDLNQVYPNCLKKVDRIVLTNNSLTELKHPNLFIYTPNLTYINFGMNQINKYACDYFKDATNLTFIKIENGPKDDLYECLFDVNKKLKRVTTQIFQIERNCNNNRLEVFERSKRRMYLGNYFSLPTFCDFPKAVNSSSKYYKTILDNLISSGSTILNVSTSSFHKVNVILSKERAQALTRIKHLEMTHIRVELFIHEDFLSPYLWNLSSINLFSSKIKEIRPAAFNGFTNLRVLNLNGNPNVKIIDAVNVIRYNRDILRVFITDYLIENQCHSIVVYDRVHDYKFVESFMFLD